VAVDLLHQRADRHLRQHGGGEPDEGPRRVRPQRPKIDYVGLITLIIGVGALQIVLDKGNDEDWFNSTFIIVTSIVSAISSRCS
jgi:hypothetical protein